VYLCNSGGLWRIWILWGGYGLDLLTAEWARSWKAHLGALFAFLGLIPSKSISSHFNRESFSGFLIPCFAVPGSLVVFFSLVGEMADQLLGQKQACARTCSDFLMKPSSSVFFSGRIDSDLVRDVLCWSASYLILSYCSVDARAASADWRAELPAVDRNTSTRVT
jgi:hypothetical protein